MIRICTYDNPVVYDKFSHKRMNSSSKTNCQKSHSIRIGACILNLRFIGDAAVAPRQAALKFNPTCTGVTVSDQRCGDGAPFADAAAGLAMCQHST